MGGHWEVEEKVKEGNKLQVVVRRMSVFRILYRRMRGCLVTLEMSRERFR